MGATKETILQEYEAKKETYGRLCSSVMQIIESLLKKEKIKYATISTRIKDEGSLADKIDRKGDKYQQLSDITDIAGIRIITYYADDVDKVAKLLEREFEVDWENSIDKRKTLKPNVFGYLSLHYIIGFSEKRMILPEYDDLKGMKAEVQIRSILQHAWAEMEHDIGYKTKIEVPEEVERDFSRLAGLLEIADKEFMEIRSKIDTYKVDVEQKLASNKNDDEIKLDAISLETLLRTDANFIAYREEFQKRTEMIIDESKRVGEEELRELQWLNIYTVKDLRSLLQKEKEASLKIATKILSDKPEGEINVGICIFYLCYAKLVREYPEKKAVQYMKENGIGRDKERKQFMSSLYSFYDSIREKV